MGLPLQDETRDGKTSIKLCLLVKKSGPLSPKGIDVDVDA